MPRNVFIVLFTYIILSIDTIQLQISSIKHYGTDLFTLFYTTTTNNNLNNNNNNNNNGNYYINQLSDS
jgi:hypothetical protein